MFRILIVLFFILVQSSDEIKAISYNIRYNNPKDGMNVWENRKATVMGLLNEQSADFVGLQEVVHAQLLDLVEGLPTYNYVGIGRKDGKTKGEYSPIFFKKDKYSVLQSNTFWLSETPDLVSKGWDASLERICTYGLFENKKNQKKKPCFQLRDAPSAKAAPAFFPDEQKASRRQEGGGYRRTGGAQRRSGGPQRTPLARGRRGERD